MDLKYTSDGKKVAVIGKLNAQETIVQEIFVINEQEIPSGENFVTKSLHDAPAVSWKEKEEARIEANLNKVKDLYKRAEEDYDKLNAALKNKSAAVRDHIKYIERVLNAEVNPDVLKTLSQFLSGELSYVVVEGYDLQIQPFFEAIQQRATGYHSEDRYEALRLISLFGNDDGTFGWQLSDYRDGSGSWRNITGFKTLEEAKERMKNLLIQQGVSDATIKKALKYGIELPENLLQEHAQRGRDAIQNEINKYSQMISDLQTKLIQ